MCFTNMLRKMKWKYLNRSFADTKTIIIKKNQHIPLVFSHRIVPFSQCWHWFVTYPWLFSCPGCRAHHLPVVNYSNHFHPYVHFHLTTFTSGLFVAGILMYYSPISPIFFQSPKHHTCAVQWGSDEVSTLSAGACSFDLLQGMDTLWPGPVPMSSLFLLLPTSNLIFLRLSCLLAAHCIKPPELQQDRPTAGSSRASVQGCSKHRVYRYTETLHAGDK